MILLLRLRPYKPCDAGAIVSWLRDEDTFRKWGGELFGAFPITARIVNEKYFAHNGDCAEPDNFYPLTACDESGPAGHFILRYQYGDPRRLRMGWVLVDDRRRGRGLGREMLALGLRFAFAFLGAELVTIGVFENNLPAYRCYKALGFRDVPADEGMIVGGEVWPVREMALTREEYEARQRAETSPSLAE